MTTTHVINLPTILFSASSFLKKFFEASRVQIKNVKSMRFALTKDKERIFYSPTKLAEFLALSEIVSIKNFIKMSSTLTGQ